MWVIRIVLINTICNVLSIVIIEHINEQVRVIWRIILCRIKKAKLIFTGTILCINSWGLIETHIDFIILTDRILSAIRIFKHLSNTNRTDGLGRWWYGDTTPD